jgi:hypothetical protein
MTTTSHPTGPAGALPPPPTAPPPSTAAARVIARRPGLPGGRAVVGALLVVTAGVGTFTLAGQDDDASTGRYPVLVRAVDPGERITPDDVVWRAMALDDEVDIRTFSTPEDLADVVALAPLNRGDLLQHGDVAGLGDPAEGAPPGSIQLSIPVPVDRTPPGLRRGEVVALLATYGSGDGAITVRAVQSATVLDYDADPDAIGAHDQGRLTLALADATALMSTAHAAQVAELTVVRTTGSAAELPETYRREDAPEDRPAA